MTKIRVPASVANVGPGFDILAFAVDLWLEVDAELSDRPSWKFEGEGAEVLKREPNLLSELPFKGRVKSQIPLGVGLGSSAAARIAAAGLQGLSPLDAYRAAAAEEGHPDNAGAAALGGFRLVTPDTEVALPVPDLGVVLFIAREPASTDEARARLPEQVPLADAVHNAGRVGLIVDALHRRDWWQLGAALDDRLHEPYRRDLYPWTAGVVAAARAAGAYGAAISGAGPSVFAFAPRSIAAAVAEAMGKAAPDRGRALVTRVSESGMSVKA